MSGRFGPEGQSLDQGVFAGLLDTRELADLVDPDNEEALCELMEETVGVSCVDCADGVPLCLGLRVEDVLGSRLLEGEVVEVSCADVVLSFLENGSCETQAGSYDVDGDGVYEGCPDL